MSLKNKSRSSLSDKSKINTDIQFLIKIQPPDNKKLVVLADDFNNFENNSIRRKLSSSSESSNCSSSEKSSVDSSKSTITDLKVENAVKTDVSLSGESQSGGTTLAGCASSSVANKTRSVLVIQNQAGKKVTIIPKTTPVVLKDFKETTKNKNLIKQIPNVPVMSISQLNKSQQYFNKPLPNLKIKKVESLAKPEPPIQLIQPIRLKKKVEFIPTLKKIQNVEEKKKRSMPDFSRLLQVLTQSEEKTLNNTPMSRIPIYVDGQTQTERVVKDQSVQTEFQAPCASPASSLDDFPNITNLVEYVLYTPKYSSGLDDLKKSDLIDMSKSIVLKGKMINQQQPRTAEQLKKQLFLDLKDCATFDFLGNKPIHNAVLENNLPLLKRQIFALRLRRISLDVENNQGQTALQLAILNNCNLDIIATLLMAGPMTSIQDQEGNTLVHLAVINSSPTVLDLLVKHIANPVKEINKKNDEGMTALMIAAIESKAEQVEMLLRWGADPNLRDEKSGRTALFHAVELNYNFVINLLLKYRADPKVRNYFGLTAIDAAKDLDIADAKLLEDDKDERSPTSVIVSLGRPEKRGRSPRTPADCKRPREDAPRTTARGRKKQ